MKIVYISRTVNVATLILVLALLISGHWFAALITTGIWWVVRLVFRGIFF